MSRRAGSMARARSLHSPAPPCPGAANYIGAGYTGPVLNEVLARNVNGAQPPWGGRPDWVELLIRTAHLRSQRHEARKRVAALRTRGRSPQGRAFPRTVTWRFGATAPARERRREHRPEHRLRPRDASGAAVLFNAAGQIVDSIAWGFQIPDAASVRRGRVEAAASATRGSANSAAASLGRRATAHQRMGRRAQWAGRLV